MKGASAQDAAYLYRGIATKTFRQSFNLADHVKAVTTGLNNIENRADAGSAEELNPRQIKIESGGTLARDNVQHIGSPKAA